jgi:hypothetical protein
VGAGLSRAAGLVSWSQLIEKVHRYRVYFEQYQGTMPPADDAKLNSRYLQEFLAEVDSEHGDCSYPILSALSKSRKTFGRTVLLNLLFRHHHRRNHALAEDDLVLQRRLWACRPQGILTTNYDTLLEVACPSDDRALLRVYRYTAAFLPFIMSNPLFVLKLHGDVNDLQTMILDPESAWVRSEQLGGPKGVHIKRLYREIIENGHLVYVGVGFRDQTILSLDSEVRATRKQAALHRVALVPLSETQPNTELGQYLRGGYYDDARFEGITFLTYEDSANPELPLGSFLGRIAAARVNTHLTPHVDEASSIWRGLGQEPPFQEPHRWRTKPWSLESSDEGL